MGTTSYYQTIYAYPSGGGAYMVARGDLGVNAGLMAAAALKNACLRTSAAESMSSMRMT